MNEFYVWNTHPLDKEKTFANKEDAINHARKHSSLIRIYFIHNGYMVVAIALNDVIFHIEDQQKRYNELMDELE